MNIKRVKHIFLDSVFPKAAQAIKIELNGQKHGLHSYFSGVSGRSGVLVPCCLSWTACAADFTTNGVANGIGFTITGTGPLHVMAAIPNNTDDKLFARLRATML